MKFDANVNVSFFVQAKLLDLYDETHAPMENLSKNWNICSLKIPCLVQYMCPNYMRINDKIENACWNNRQIWSNLEFTEIFYLLKNHCDENFFFFLFAHNYVKRFSDSCVVHIYTHLQGFAAIFNFISYVGISTKVSPLSMKNECWMWVFDCEPWEGDVDMSAIVKWKKTYQHVLQYWLYSIPFTLISSYIRRRNATTRKNDECRTSNEQWIFHSKTFDWTAKQMSDARLSWLYACV